MTSNLGGHVFGDIGAGPEEQEEKVLAEVRASFRPEFVNRIDEIVVFRPLSRDDIARILDIQVRLLQERVADRHLTLELTDAAREYLSDKGYDPAYGARPLKRLIQREIQDALALKLLSGDVREGETVEIDAAGGGLVF